MATFTPGGPDVAKRHTRTSGQVSAPENITDTPLRQWSPAEREALLYGGQAAARLGRKPPKGYEGVVERFERIHLRTSDTVSERKQDTIRRFTRAETCRECAGDRLKQAARTATVLDHTIGEMSRLEITELVGLVRTIRSARVAPVVAALTARLKAMITIGLGYLALSRATTTLSGGESQRIKTELAPRPATGHFTVAGASRNNLRHVTARFPTGVMTVLTGVAGSGKSSLADELVAQHDATVIDQKPVSTNRRSTPITYTGIAPAIRTLFARHNHVAASLFSANSDGACPGCNGLGVIYTDLAFMDGQEVSCETCQGRRFTPEVLAHTVNGLSIADVDDLTIDQAIAQLPDEGISRALRQVSAVGLGYLRLGQSLSTLSGGECQRVKIAKELRHTKQPTTYVLDEPTTGLHLNDIDTLLHVLDSLVEQGHTVVVIEHNLDVIRQADWLIDLGPGPGRHGGTILFDGHVADYTGHPTPTCDALRRTEPEPDAHAR